MAASDKPAKRRKAEERVDIANLQFGEEFEGAECMFNAEVKIIIDTLRQNNQLDFDDLSDMMQNTSKYVDMCGEFQDEDSIKECREKLQKLDEELEEDNDDKSDWKKNGLHTFEVASLGNLMPVTADEAKNVIPSLSRFSDKTILAACNVVQRYKKSTS